MQAISNTTTEVILGVFANCELPNAGDLCVAFDLFGEALVNGTASAFAQGLANATSFCPDETCNVQATISAQAIQPIFSFAFANLEVRYRSLSSQHRLREL